MLRDGADGAFNRIVVDFDPAIPNKLSQSIKSIETVVDSKFQAALTVRLRLFKPEFDFRQDG